MHMCVLVTLEARKGRGSDLLEMKLQVVVITYYGHLEPYASPLGEQQVLLMAELALRPFVFQFKS